jgi:hypothetical protein
VDEIVPLTREHILRSLEAEKQADTEQQAERDRLRAKMRDDILAEIQAEEAGSRDAETHQTHSRVPDGREADIREATTRRSRRLSRSTSPAPPVVPSPVNRRHGRSLSSGGSTSEAPELPQVPDPPNREADTDGERQSESTSTSRS